MDIKRLPYSERLLLTQDSQHPEHPFELQEALSLLVPGEALVIHLGEEEQYNEVRSLVEQFAKTVGIDNLEFGKRTSRTHSHKPLNLLVISFMGHIDLKNN